MKILKNISKLVDNKKQKQIELSMAIIEQVIEPLYYPKRGVSGEKYYELEDRIIKILKNYE